MSDYFFKKFYQGVKDPSWPNAENITEFHQLPERIKQECFDVHSLEQRLDEIQDPDYLRRHSNHSNVLCKKDLVFLPVRKCANTYYTNILQQQGWVVKNLCDLDLEKLHAFGLIMNPLTRRLKGIAQLLDDSFDNNSEAAIKMLSDRCNSDFIKNISIMDSHSTPYSVAYGDKLEQVTWFPIDVLSEIEIKNKVMEFCKEHGVELCIPIDGKRRNKSSLLKLELYQTLKDIFLNQEEVISELYLLYAEDIKFYRNLIKQYI